MTEPSCRLELISAITKLLAGADFRQLRLVWVYASHLIGQDRTKQHKTGLSKS